MLAFRYADESAIYTIQCYVVNKGKQPCLLVSITTGSKAAHSMLACILLSASPNSIDSNIADAAWLVKDLDHLGDVDSTKGL